MRRILFALTLSVLSFYGNAAILEIKAMQVGDNVEFFGSGAIDLAGFGSPAPIGLGFAGNRNNRDFGVVDGALVDRYTTTGSFTSFTSFANTNFDLESYSTTETGDAFYMNLPRPFTINRLRVTRGYTSLDPFSFTWRALNAQLADLQLNFGTIAEFGNNTILLTGEPIVEVPSPSAQSLYITALLGFLCIAIPRKFGNLRSRKNNLQGESCQYIEPL